MMTPSSSWSITISGVTHLPRPWMTPRLLERSAPVLKYIENCFCSCGHPFHRAERHLHREDHASTWTRLCPNASPVCFNQPFGHGQAESRAGWMSSAVLFIENTIELVEHTLKIALRNTGATVRDADEDLRPVAVCADVDG